MKNQKYDKNIILSNNTEFLADNENYDFYPDDLTISTCNELVSYFSDRRSYEKFAVLGENLENVTIDFNGATLCIHDMATQIAFYKCKNITIKNVKLKYDRPMYSECKILETGEDYARVHFNDNFKVRCEYGKLIPYSDEWSDNYLSERQVFFQFFDSETFDGEGITLGLINPSPDIDQDMCFNPVLYSVELFEDDVIFRTVNGESLLPEWKKGRVLAIEHADREHPAIFLHSCENVILDNVRLINTSGMGIQPFHTKNLYINKLFLKHDEESMGVINHSADAIHAICCSGDFVLSDSIIGGCMDDAVNIHSQFLTVTSVNGNNALLKINARGVTQYANLCDIGDEIAVYNGKTLEIKDTAVILSKKVIDTDTCEVKLSKSINAKAGDTVENLSSQVNVTFVNNTFEKANTHIRMQTRGKVLIENCITELPIILTGDMNFWYESSPCQDVTIRHTFFAKPDAVVQVIPEFNPTCFAPYYHTNVKIDNCLFVSDIPLEANYCDNINFVRNRNCNRSQMKLVFNNCGEYYIDNAVVVQNSNN